MIIGIAFLLLVLASGLFMVRLFLGPTVADRVVALDGLLMAVMCGVLVGVAHEDTSVSLDTVLVVALLGFIGTGVLARYVEKRGG